MHTVANHVGRLLEVTLASPLTLPEVDQFVRENIAAMQGIPGKFVGVADLRGAHVFAVEVTDRLIQLLSGNAARVERSAMLIGESALFALQVERVLRSSNQPNRRAFRDAAEMTAWLNEVLTAPEQARLQQFLREAATGSP
jgi:hypothetical protein